MKILFARSLDAVLLLSIYFGAYKGNQYAENIIMPMAWILIVLCIFAAMILQNKDFRSKFKIGREPKSYASKCYSYTYDVVVFFALCAFGYTVTGVFWAIALFLAQGVISGVDNEIKDEALKNEPNT